MGATEIGLLLASGLIMLGGWAVYRLVVRQGRLLLQIEGLEQQVEGLRRDLAAAQPQPDGLPMGGATVDFELPRLEGGRARRSQWLGRRLLLIFFDPRCPFSRALLPALAALPDPDGERPLPVILSSGPLEAHRALFEQYGARWPVLLQESMEVALLYRVTSTPAGYLVDERGAIASRRAAGARELLALALAPSDERLAVGTTPIPPRQRPGRGLAVGAPAPDFRLLGLDGSEMSLERHRGRRVLLVFVDPACEACDWLLPALEAVQHGDPDLQVLLVSRGDPVENRTWLARCGVDLPMGLQKRWEISFQYGILAAPIGYLIGTDGTVAAPVAIGAAQVLHLVASPGARIVAPAARSE